MPLIHKLCLVENKKYPICADRDIPYKPVYSIHPRDICFNHGFNSRPEPLTWPCQAIFVHIFKRPLKSDS